MRALIFVAVAGCGFTPTLVGDGGGDDDGSNTCTTFSSFVETCTLTDGRGVDLVISGTSTYNTDTNDLRNNGAAMQMLPGTVANGGATGMVRVVVARNITISGTLTVRGTFPLVLVAFGDARFDGHVELSSGGAGARNDPDCTLAGALGGAGANDSNPDMNAGGGGGGGGAFAGSGGGGSIGDTDDGSSPAGPNGVAMPLPSTLVGGCSGGRGGDGEDPNSGGSAGKGGGAIAVAATGTITIGPGGAIAVNGGGGGGGKHSGGGGAGGGAGGMLVLEATAISHAGILLANGGGGAEGADSNGDGDHGDDGHYDMTPAKGGSGGAGEGANGGDGGAGTMVDGHPAIETKHGGGGGGGGGTGFIAIKSPVSGAGMFSPPSVPWP